MNSIQLKNVPHVIQGLLDEYHRTKQNKTNLKAVWRDVTSNCLQVVVQALDPLTATVFNVQCVSKLFLPEDPDVALSYRWSATLGDIYEGLCSACRPEETVWIDILFNGQNSALTPEAVLQLTPSRYQKAKRHILLVTTSQDLVGLLLRGWICFEIAVRMVSDKPMVELVDPHRKASELYQSGGLRSNFFEAMETFKPEDGTLIRNAIFQLFARGNGSYLTGADPETNFNRGVRDFVHLTGGKLLVSDLADQASWQRITEEAWTLSQEMADKGKFSDCVFVRERLLTAVQHVHGHEHTNVAANLDNLGLAYEYLGDHKKALEYHERALAIEVKTKGHEHIDVATTLLNIGVVYVNQGEYDSALAKYEQALAIQVKIHGHEHIDVAKTEENIGVVYQSMGNLKEALAKYEFALRIKTQVHGQDHIDVATSLLNTGAAYQEQGENQFALAKFEQALAIQVKIHGHEHIDVAKTEENIGVVYQSMGNLKEALAKYEFALRIKTQVHGQDHIDVATTLMNMGTAYTQRGEFDLALAKHEESVRIMENVHGHEHIDVANSIESIGVVYMEQGEFGLALGKLEQALHTKEKIHGDEHADVAATLTNIGVVYDKLGEHKKGLAHREKALAIQIKCKGDDHPDVVREKAFLDARRGRDDEATTGAWDVESADAVGFQDTDGDALLFELCDDHLQLSANGAVVCELNRDSTLTVWTSTLRVHMGHAGEFTLGEAFAERLQYLTALCERVGMCVNERDGEGA